VPDVTMPRLSDSMEEGTILKWLKDEGEDVQRGEEIVEIETDKANMTYEADADGELSIVAQEGDTLPVGEVIARIGGESQNGGAPSAGEAEGSDEAGAEEAEDEETATSRPAAETERDAEPEPEDAGAPAAQEDEQPADARAGSQDGGGREPSSDGGQGERIKASPVARRMAREHGVELSTLEGSGPGGRIVKADVEGAAENGGGRDGEEPSDTRRDGEEAEEPAARKGETDTVKGAVEIEELSRTQQVIARRMAESKATAPEFTLQAEIDMEEAVRLRGRLKEIVEGDPVPSFNDFVIKACARALREFPRANGAYRDGRFELYSRVNVGFAVAAQDALLVPTVFDADAKSLVEIARDTRALAERAREGQATAGELGGGTFAVSNLGMFGIRNFTAVINPPQAAILAVGALERRPVVVDGAVTVRSRMDVTLTCDHRILYGADAAEFLARIRQLLEEPLLGL
jgi:pyruvate dehydrogenase E2 component (dihydrolipoamide acetyltransferase)